MEGAEVTIVHRGGATKRTQLIGFDDPKRPIVLLRFPLAGVYRANLNHGWLEAPAGDWRIVDSQIEELRAWANREEHWVTVPRSSGRPPAPKQAAKVSAKQTSFQGGGLE